MCRLRVLPILLDLGGCESRTVESNQKHYAQRALTMYHDYSYSINELLLECPCFLGPSIKYQGTQDVPKLETRRRGRTQWGTVDGWWDKRCMSAPCYLLVCDCETVSPPALCPYVAPAVRSTVLPYGVLLYYLSSLLLKMRRAGLAEWVSV